jgi:hypothetical protein
MKKMWLLQFVANALILFAFYEWLGIRDSRASQLILSFVLGLAIVAGTVFLHSRTFHLTPFRFAALLGIFLLICWGLMALPLDKWGLWTASTLTLKLRKPVKPEWMFQIFDDIRIVIQWIVVPLLLLQNRSAKFWIQYIAIVIGAFFIPAFLIHWNPKPDGTILQVTSFVLRFGAAYCLMTTGFAALWWFTSAGTPVESQPSTPALP